ncbi:MAG: FAD-dependent oxidoreductase [Acidobacteriota bacterium]|nr:FAD-dependent oxidoreductase [Acidobacteriota bacterium]
MSLREIFEQFPEAIAERVRWVTEKEVPAAGRHVVYWMHHAVRGHENPALDAAMLAAVALEVPLLVYQGLGGGHRFDNDRHHTFILEGARDVRAELAERGIVHAFHLGEDPTQPAPLHGLAESAALVVTEDFPAPPFPRWTQKLAARTAAPVWAVDTACVVPMRLVSKPYDRAFRFRNAIQSLLAERLGRPWIEVDERPLRFDLKDLPFEDTDLAALDSPQAMAEVVARCPIDHTVGPVHHTRGGSVAGYERWRSFKQHGLKGYAARRNDATQDGVSRLSAYLHHGHVSPLRIAREAAAMAATGMGKGAEKYLDELIVWRELAHNLCCHRHREVESLAILPNWARETLEEHAGDGEALPWETLARGRTGDRLWDLCQASLVRHGELHNNVRMTWGKAIVGWAGGPQRALELLLDLNHRFALDGSDPNSYGGLLWCLGLFDRPFQPERPVLGTVRSRSTQSHARRLDLEAYAQKVLAPATERPLEVAVVGAGLAGLACARTLADHGHRVRVFDKARGVGGRMSTRRAEELRYDHGAQYFTARNARLRRWVDSWCQAGVVARWEGRIAVLEEGTVELKKSTTERFVGVPGMNALCKHLSQEAGTQELGTQDLELTLQTRVTRLLRDESAENGGPAWRLEAEDGSELGSYDAVVVTAPATQAAELLEAAAPRLAVAARKAETAPCWAVMVTFPQPLELDFDGAFVHGSPLSWIARNASKPGRPEGESWVLHASPEWSREHLELSREEVAPLLLEALRRAVGKLGSPALAGDPAHLTAHRWRYALPTEPLPEPCLFDPELHLAAAGDWCGGPRVEGAFLSGCAAAGRTLSLRPRARPSEDAARTPVQAQLWEA